MVVLSSVGSRFQMQSTATEKVRSPSLSLVDCWTRSLLLAERFEARPGMGAVVVSRSCK